MVLKLREEALVVEIPLLPAEPSSSLVALAPSVRDVHQGDGMLALAESITVLVGRQGRCKEILSAYLHAFLPGCLS